MIAEDAVSFSGWTALLAGPIALAHTIAGANRLIVVTIAINAAGVGTSVVTFNAANMTYGGSKQSPGTGHTEIYYMVNPPVGTTNISVTLNNPSRFAFGGKSFTGVDQISPVIGGFNSANNGSLAQVNMLTTAPGQWCVGTMWTDDFALPALNGGFSDYASLGPGGTANQAHIGPIGSPGNNGIGYTLAHASNFAMQGLVINPVGGNIIPRAGGSSGTRSQPFTNNQFM